LWQTNTIILAFVLLACGDTIIENDCADPIGSEDRTVGHQSLICFHEDFSNCFEITFSSSAKQIRSVIIDGGGEASIIDTGVVSCLGEVTSKPAEGFASVVDLLPGHGYVVRLHDNSYGRLYVESFTGSLVNMTWQYAF
jgi:hypothetical protein